MKKYISALCLTLTCLSNAWADSPVGQCVYPKTKVAKNGHLELKPGIMLYADPKDSNPKPLKEISAYSVKAYINGFIQLVSVPDYELADPDKAAGKVIGWVKLTDFKFLDLRNCT